MFPRWFENVPWASYQIHKITGCACTGDAGNVFPSPASRKQLVSDPGMHHGTCVTHVPWCMSRSLTRGGGENVPGITSVCATAILRIVRSMAWLPTHGSRWQQFVDPKLLATPDWPTTRSHDTYICLCPASNIDKIDQSIDFRSQREYVIGLIIVSRPKLMNYVVRFAMSFHIPQISTWVGFVFIPKKTCSILRS